MNSPEVIDTRVGVGGAQLSGGQRQRIGLARALVRNPAILILDEAISSIDQPSRASIRQTLMALRPDMAIILIGHTLDAIDSANRAIVLEGGCVVDQGLVSDLRTREGVFNSLYKPEASNKDLDPAGEPNREGISGLEAPKFDQ